MAKRPAIINIKDIAVITGKSYKTAQREMKKIKDELNLKRNDYLSISAYCKHTNISMDDVILALNVKI